MVRPDASHVRSQRSIRIIMFQERNKNVKQFDLEQHLHNQHLQGQLRSPS
jgi:hypothetical protein